ncbi:hypothetical protein [Massilibacteroides vaginae]|uniref:hypothetical protein n=1 Tax=Massilibacteroides vaginae TaxID=1673718 RepID=UPI00111C7E97|nr:hypothetical protein [Massilibacteroides vaginae]
MTFFKSLFLLSFTAIIFSCSNDDEAFKFNTESLYQTTWEGIELVTDGDEIIRTINVVMQFFTTDSGQYILKEEGYSTGIYEFKYSIEGKIMDIKDGPLFSKRTLLDFSKDRIVLEAIGSYKVTLTLTRKY